MLLSVQDLRVAKEACKALEKLLQNPEWLIAVKTGVNECGDVFVLVMSHYDRPHIRLCLPSKINNVPVKIKVTA